MHLLTAGLPRRLRSCARMTFVAVLAAGLAGCQLTSSSKIPLNNNTRVFFGSDAESSIGAREHPRVVASYGGVYKNAGGGRGCCEGGRPAGRGFTGSVAGLQGHDPQFACHQCVCPSRGISLRHARPSRPGQ